VIEITSINSWNVPLGRPNPVTINISQTSPEVVSVNGVPVAINRPLKAACTGDQGTIAGGQNQNGSGPLAYVLTNPGQGSGQVVLLPNTGDGPIFFNPLTIVAMLITPGIFLVLVSGLLNRRRKAQPMPVGDDRHWN
jgi:hypothetical protein